MIPTIILTLAVIAIAIYLLAIITDEYFIVSLDQISVRLKLPHNVAGASLMAAGSSAPELAIALLALFTAGGSHSDVGIATIVGSAVFNILIITGASAIARPANIRLRVVARDVTMYLVSVGLLLATIYDGAITVAESLVFLATYAIYLFILFRWNRFDKSEELDVIELVEAELAAEHQRSGFFFRMTTRVSDVIGLLMGNARRSYLRAFAVSILLICIISYVLIESAVLFADAVGIPAVIVALTILAGGTSVPDLFASVTVARQGRGQMAVANAVGSNIFDILIGLGLPWLLALVFLGDSVAIGIEGLWTSALLLLGTVIILGFFLITNRKLSRWEGIVMVILYAIFVVWTWFSG